MAISKVTSAIVVVLTAVSCSFAALHVNEALFNGFTVLHNVNNELKKLADNELWPVNETVKAVCPLLDRQRELKQFVSSGLGKAANMTEIEATEIILKHVLNDTCNWIKSLPNLSNFVCSDQDYSGLESFCIKQEIAEIVPHSAAIPGFLQDMFHLYGAKFSGVNIFHASYNYKWINQSGFTSDKTLSALQTVDGYKQYCSKEGQKIVCIKND